jgi:hypothetical protein
VEQRIKEVEKATTSVSETPGYNLCEETNLSPEEYARRGLRRKENPKH